MGYAGVRQHFDPRCALVWSAGDGEALQEIVRDERGVRPFLHGLADVERIHEGFDSGELLFGNRFQGEAEVVVCPIGQPAADAFASPIAIVIDRDHAGQHDVDVGETASAAGWPIGHTTSCST